MWLAPSWDHPKLSFNLFQVFTSQTPHILQGLRYLRGISQQPPYIEHTTRGHQKMAWVVCNKYCRTANFHVLVILTNLTNEKNSLKLQLVKVSSQNCQKRNFAIIDEILIKSGDTNRPTWTFIACRHHNTVLFSYHILFNNKHNI